MGELRARFARDGDQIAALIRTPGKKWRKIDAVRRRQRRCVLKMLARPVQEQSRALRRVAPYVLQGNDVLDEYERGEGHQIYVQTSIQVRHSY